MFQQGGWGQPLSWGKKITVQALTNPSLTAPACSLPARPENPSSDNHTFAGWLQPGASPGDETDGAA